MKRFLSGVASSFPGASEEEIVVTFPGPVFRLGLRKAEIARCRVPKMSEQVGKIKDQSYRAGLLVVLAAARMTNMRMPQASSPFLYTRLRTRFHMSQRRERNWGGWELYFTCSSPGALIPAMALGCHAGCDFYGNGRCTELRCRGVRPWRRALT